ncbi:MAG: hypothetical protein JWR42_1455 [Marmoricola sp.]|nr:hypothetical protein [Marmoricola sp.]
MTAAPGPAGEPGTPEPPELPASPDSPDGGLPPGLEASLAAATAQLRSRPLPRSVEIADEVLRRSLEAPRPSVLVRGRERFAFVQVSSTVITAIVQRRLDGALTGAAVSRVLLDVGRDRQLRAATVELFVRFGTDIMSLADEARDLAQDVLEELLGPESGTAPATEVLVGHVHVSDVTIGDPRLVDPDEE